MGWQLFPVGIGWREFTSTPGRGEFACPNPRCKSTGLPTAYQHKAGRNWFTLLFVPVIPMNKTGEWVRCGRCKSLYPLDVIDRGRASSAVAPAAAPPNPSRPPEAAPVEQAAMPLPPPAAPTIRFVDGSEIELIDSVVIGRDPSPVAEHPFALMHSVHDPTVSKTHLVVGRTGDDVWVLDNHSSNGVFIGTSSTQGDRIPAGRRVVLAASAVVSIGDATAFILGESPTLVTHATVNRPKSSSVASPRVR